MTTDVLLIQGVDNIIALPFVNPPAYVGGPTTVPDPTAITSAHLTVEDANYGAAVLPTLTLGSGITFGLDGSGTACTATIKWTAAQMSSILGTLTQPRTSCVGNLNFTAGAASGTIPLRVQIYPNATSGV